MASSCSIFSAVLVVLDGSESTVVTWEKAQQDLINKMNKSTVESSILG